MYSALLLAAGLAGLGVALWALRAWLAARSNLLMFVIVTLAGGAAQALIMGLGQRMGAGDPLRDLYALPALTAIFALPLTLYTMATMSRRYGFAWAVIDWGHGAVCLFGTALLLASLPAFLALKQLWPACWQDVVWYARVVPQGQACPGTTPGAAGAGPLPLARWAVLLPWLGLGLGLWLRRGWPWLAAGMVPGVLLLLLPAAAGPVPAAAGTVLCYAAMALAAVKLAREFP